MWTAGHCGLRVWAGPGQQPAPQPMSPRAPTPGGPQLQTVWKPLRPGLIPLQAVLSRLGVLGVPLDPAHCKCQVSYRTLPSQRVPWRHGQAGPESGCHSSSVLPSALPHRRRCRRQGLARRFGEFRGASWPRNPLWGGEQGVTLRIQTLSRPGCLRRVLFSPEPGRGRQEPE